MTQTITEIATECGMYEHSASSPEYRSALKAAITAALRDGAVGNINDFTPAHFPRRLVGPILDELVEDGVAVSFDDETMWRAA